MVSGESPRFIKDLCQGKTFINLHLVFQDALSHVKGHFSQMTT